MYKCNGEEEIKNSEERRGVFLETRDWNILTIKGTTE